MAQLVVRRMVPVSVSMSEEVAEMVRIGLISITEKKAILNKRKEFERKINEMKMLQDYKDYIQYELTLIKDINLRQDKFSIAESTSVIKVKILERIKEIYERAMQKFPLDFDFSLAFLNFCKESNFNRTGSFIVQNMITNFENIADMWETAVDWYMKWDIERALSTMHYGLTTHRSCKNLYIKAIQLEFYIREKDYWSNNVQNKSKDQICYNKIEIYVNTIFQNINCFTFLINVMSLLEPHSFTENIQDKITKHLMDNYHNEPEVWRALAEREKKIHSTVPDEVGTSTKFSLKCLETFEMGLSKISDDKKSEMWILYLDFLSDLYGEEGLSNKIVTDILLQKLEEASKESILTEEYYITWVKLLPDKNRELEIVEKGLNVLPKSVELWKLKLKCFIMKDDLKGLNVAFKQGQLALKENAISLWHLYTNYHLLMSPNEIIEAIYEDAVKQVKQISDVFKPEYIQWIVLQEGIGRAREIYKTLSVTPPYCKELHEKMVKIERFDLEVSVMDLELPLHLACKQFGDKYADVWINLRDCYLEYQKLFKKTYPKFNIKRKIQELKRDAKEALKDNVMELISFDHEFNRPGRFNTI